MVPTKPLEIVVKEAIRTIRADGREEESDAVTACENSHQDVASRRGALSCRRRARLRQVVGYLLSCSFSATSTAGVRWLPEKLHRQTLKHFLTFVAERKC